VRVVIVRGAGPSFSSGLDRAVMGTTLTVGDEQIAAFQDGFAWLGRPELISVAAVHGYALGAGCQLALACDLRVLAEDAQLSLPEPSLGLVPDLGGTHPLVQAVGYSRALEICLTGRRVGAAEAYRIGLANAVVPVDQLEAAVLDLVGAVLGPTRGAATETKALLQAALGHDVAEQRVTERAAQLRRLADMRGAAGDPPGSPATTGEPRWT